MLKNAKKLLSLLLAFSLLITISISAFAEVDTRVRTAVESLGLMVGYEDGSFGEDDELTRAQMCTIVARILQVEGVGFGVSTFTDVADDHWAKDSIAALASAGIVNGMGDGTFMPEKSVSYSEVIKLLVAVLGYSDLAEESGGYPNGYILQANRLRLLKDVTVEDASISRGVVAQILYNALSVKPMSTTFMQNYPEATYTLEEILHNNRDLIQFQGVLTETSRSSLVAAEPTLKDGLVIVGGRKLIESMPMEDYLGQELIVYAYLDEDLDKYVIKNFFVSNDTVVIDADAENVVWNGDEAVIYDDEGEELEELSLSGVVKTIYNGRLASVPANERGIVYGSYRFVDPDDNNVVDYLFIDEAQSFIIDKVNTKNNTVYFKDRAMLNGRNTIVLDKEDDKKDVALVDADGNEIAVSDLEENWAITVFASKDWKYVKAIVSEETVAGKVTEISADGIRVDGESYEIAKKPNGTDAFVPNLNEEATYILDCYGKLVGNIGAVKSSYLYAYVINATHGSGLDNGLSLQTVTGQAPQKEVVVKGDEEKISYYFQNEAIKIYDCAAKFNFNGTRVDASGVSLDLVKNKLVAFRLDSEGKIRELYTAAVPGSIAATYAFNADIIAFGGEQAVGRGFATDENTVFVCVPENMSDTANFSVQLKIADESAANKVTGTVFFPDFGYEDPDAEPVDILMIKAEMNASVVSPIPADGNLCIVGEVLRSVDAEGGQVYNIKMLEGENETEIATKIGSNAETVARGLRKGDLIRYVKDGSGQATNIVKLVSVQGLDRNYSSDVYINSSVETAKYGLAYHSVPSVYDYKTNQMVDRLQLTFDVDGINKSNVYRLFHEDMPTVYKYDRRGGWISAGSIDDIRSYNQVGEDADGILAIIENNDVKAFVIITDY